MIWACILALVGGFVSTFIGFLAGYMCARVAAEDQQELAVELANGEGHEQGYNLALEEMADLQKQQSEAAAELEARIHTLVENAQVVPDEEDESYWELPRIVKVDKKLN